MTLADQYRPKELADVVGQGKAVRVLQGLLKRGIGGRALMITGKSGTGKTTIAEILANRFGSDIFGIDREVGRTLTVARLRELRCKWAYCGTHVLIVNEFHGMAKPVIEFFLELLEGLSEGVLVVFTSTIQAQVGIFDEKIDASPFKSRCMSIRLTDQGLAPLFAKRAKEIAQAEGLDGKSDSAYLALVNEHHSNFRAVLQAIESGRMAEN